MPELLVMRGIAKSVGGMPRRAQNPGIAAIYQETTLYRDLTMLELSGTACPRNEAVKHMSCRAVRHDPALFASRGKG